MLLNTYLFCYIKLCRVKTFIRSSLFVPPANFPKSFIFKMRAVALVLLMAIGYSSAQIFGLGSCPDVTVLTDFDASKFLGTWYENRKYFTIFEATGKCIKADYATTAEDGVLSVINSQINILTKAASTIEGTAKLDSDNGEAKLTVTFPSGWFSTDAPYWVLGSDYENYAVIWSCGSALNVANGKVAWILTRERVPSDEVVASAIAVLTANGIETSSLQVTDQTDCSN